MAEQESGSPDSVKPGDKLWYKGEQVTVIYVIPAHQWPADHEKGMDEGMRKHMTPPKANPPQQLRESIEFWKKWREDQYIVCYPPNQWWISTTKRVKLVELSTTPPPKEEGKEPKKNGTRRLQKRSGSRTK